MKLIYLISQVFLAWTFKYSGHYEWAKIWQVQFKKNLVKSNKSISRNFILTKFHFLQFQKWPKINFWTRRSLKLSKMQFHESNLWFIWFHEFFCLDFFKFSGPLCNTYLVFFALSAICLFCWLTHFSLLACRIDEKTWTKSLLYSYYICKYIR